MHNEQQNRNGFTLLELVVVIFIIVILVALLLPSIRTAREPARRMQCLNNIRNVSVAIHNFASSNHSRLPNQAYYPSNLTTNNGELETFEGRSWVVELLPYLDGNSYYDRWQKDQPWNSTFKAGEDDVSNSSIASTYVSCLACPNDESAFQVPGGLSYVLNCGIGDLNWHTKTGIRDADHLESGQHYLIEPFDWNGNGILPPEDQEDALITSDFTVFWPDFPAPTGSDAKPKPRAAHALSKIYDGTSNTVMIGENLKAGTRPDQTQTSWADPQVCSSGFILPIDAKRISPTSHATDGSLATLVVSKPNNPAINASKNTEEGTAPFLNSNHPGIVTVSFLDGSAKTLSENIDMQVYARLLTPCGTMERDIEGFVPEQTLDSDEF